MIRDLDVHSNASGSFRLGSSGSCSNKYTYFYKLYWKLGRFFIRGRGNMLKYKKLIEALRLILSTSIGISMAFHWINIIFGLFLALILGLIDQIFVKRYIKKK